MASRMRRGSAFAGASGFDMKQADAKPLIIAAFDAWRTERGLRRPTGHDAFAFFGDLNREHPKLLDFRCSGDKWQRVHGWLIRARRVSN